MASDFLFPMTPDLQLVKDEYVVIQNVVQILYTRPAENIYYPSLGVGLYDYIWENRHSIINIIQEPLRRQLELYEPDFQDVFIDVKAQGSGVYLDIMGKVLKYGVAQISMPLEV